MLLIPLESFLLVTGFLGSKIYSSFHLSCTYSYWVTFSQNTRYSNSFSPSTLTHLNGIAYLSQKFSNMVSSCSPGLGVWVSLSLLWLFFFFFFFFNFNTFLACPKFNIQTHYPRHTSSDTLKFKKSISKKVSKIKSEKPHAAIQDILIVTDKREAAYPRHIKTDSV